MSPQSLLRLTCSRTLFPSLSRVGLGRCRSPRTESSSGCSPSRMSARPACSGHYRGRLAPLHDGRESETPGGNTRSENPQDGSLPTVVLVHGALAESASWNSVIRRLHDQGYTVIAAANPLRSVAGDAEFVAGIFEAIEEPIVLVGHSYGGSVISNAARDNENVKALVYVAGFAPEEGENAFELSGRFPGSTLGEALWPVPLSDGSTDLYIRQEVFHQQFAQDVPAELTALMAVGQRPVRDVALNEASGAPAWKSTPSWFVFGELDKNIPAALHRFMAERAEAREVVEIEGASHALGVSHPEEVADVILRALTDVE